jgi:hypothetical protein
VYDRRGRLIRSVTTAEPRWTEQDRAEAIALALYRERPCPCGCGNPAALTLLPEAAGPEWVVTETPCTARLALIEQQNAVPEGRQKYLGASLWSVRPRKG